MDSTPRNSTGTPSIRMAVVLALILFFFMAFTMPLAFERVAGGRSAERQGYTAGIVRMYCLDPAHSIVNGPEIHFGNNPFNLELTVFEWAEGVVARLSGGAACDAQVEVVAKVFSIICSALGVLAAALLALELWGPVAALLSAILLATDELWLRYATYSMIENRVIMLGAFAVLLSLRRRPKSAAVFWAITFMQKPQIFIFLAAFWIGVELTGKLAVKPSGMAYFRYLKRSLWRDRKLGRVALGFLSAAALSTVWFAWSNRLDAQSDLPWIIHTGPRALKWYFGNWHERLTPGFAWRFVVSWTRESGLNVAFPALAMLAVVGRVRFDWKMLLRRGLPLFFALGAYFYLFYAVFIVHEYYALPMNFGRVVTTAGVIALVFEAAKAEQWRGLRLRGRWNWIPAVGWVLAVVVVGRYAAIGLRDYMGFALNINNPNTDFFQTEWDRQIFPQKNTFVVVAAPGTGRDLLFLYNTKQRGFVWCSQNQEFAPRAYWKSQGIKYVAWAGAPDPTSRHYIWTVRTIDEELAYARARGWSTDTNDPWTAYTMAEWAALASRTGNDPCLGNPDPRKW